jgi:hypothetical protein
MIADEEAHGLTPNVGLTLVDDLDGLITFFPGVISGASAFGPPAPGGVDTLGGGAPDSPLVYFTFNPASPGGIPVAVAALGAPAGPGGAVICHTGLSPGLGVPAPDVLPAALPVDLGLLPTDNIDALFVDATGMNLVFSLDKFSPSLDPVSATIIDPFTPGFGADSTDLIYVTLGAPLGAPPFGPGPGGYPPPIIPPTRVVTGAMLGLTGDGPSPAPDLGHPDNLNALWITDGPLAGPLVPVELSVFTAD